MTLRPLLLVDIDGVLNVYGIDTCPPGTRNTSSFPTMPSRRVWL